MATILVSFLSLICIKPSNSFKLMMSLNNDVQGNSIWTTVTRPLKRMVIESSREKIRSRGKEIGSDIQADVEYYLNEPVLSKIQSIQMDIENNSISYPEYYKHEFHGYVKGNLDWLPAFEYQSVSESVFSDVFSKIKLSKQSNRRLRENAQRAMRKYFESHRFVPRVIVDMGCAIGLSTLPLARSFTQAEVVGIDLSSYFLATAVYNLNTDEELIDLRSRISYMHGAAESCGLPSSSVDFVSFSLMEHELPNQAALDVIREAHRILRPGGAIAFMDMDPESIYIKNFNKNWLAKAAFAVTEPWFQDFCRFPMEEMLKANNFVDIKNVKTSPKHRTILALKKGM